MTAAGAEQPPAVLHIAEVLDASLRGLPVSSLTSRAAATPDGTQPPE
jgi:hypothetical protein